MQFSEETDRTLNSLEHWLSKAVANLEEAQNRYDTLFGLIFGAFDQTVGAGLPASFICDDGYKLARLVPKMSPQVDGEKVRQTIFAQLSPENTNLWQRVTDSVRVVNQEKLAREITKNPSLGEALHAAGAIAIPTRKPSRIRTKATRAELSELKLEPVKEITA